MKIIRAEKLISGLGGERERWIHVSTLNHLVSGVYHAIKKGLLGITYYLYSVFGTGTFI